ncbi:hypothetical protein C8Q80DRAFT_1275440 [Daedaleopsis nitida]|nr:hypothetical protein C8Q80DRAFT_1275440 [Daedaleopsis nitida]
MGHLIDSAELAGLALEGPLYGIFLCLFMVCGYDLYRRRASEETRLTSPMVVAGVLLILLATARFAVDVSYIFVAFVQIMDGEERVLFLEDVTQPLFTAKHSIFIVTLLVGDLFVNYRCWVACGRNIWVITIPVTISIMAAASGSYSLWAYNHLTNQSIFAQQQALKLFFSGNLVANALGTSGPALCPYAGQSTSFSPVMRIMLESGLINAAFLSGFVIAAAIGSPSLEILSKMGVPMCGIVFSVVIFRVGLRRRHRSGFGTSDSQPPLSTLTWAVAAKSVAEPGPSDHRLPSSPTALRVFVRNDTAQKHDPFDPYGSGFADISSSTMV